MLVCTKPLLTIYAGAETRLLPSISHVAKDHELVARFPHHFKPAPGPSRGPREQAYATFDATSARVIAQNPVPRASAALRGLERWRIAAATPQCRIGGWCSDTRIRLPASARAELVSIIAATTARDHQEVGGLAFGPEPQGDLIEVLKVSGPGPRAVRSDHSYCADGEHDLARVDAMQAAGLQVVGEWHSQPTSRGDPSRVDLEGFSQIYRRIETDRYAAMIVTETRDGWQLCPWIVRAGANADLAELGSIIELGKHPGLCRVDKARAEP